MLTNESLTIYNKVPDREKKCFVYKKHYIPAVHFYTDQKTKLEGTGVKSADIYKIRIPEEHLEGYVPPDIFVSLDAPKEYWTVENEDLFIQGDGPEGIERIGDLVKLHKPYGAVKSWSDNRRGQQPHIRFGGAV